MRKMSSIFTICLVIFTIVIICILFLPKEKNSSEVIRIFEDNYGEFNSIQQYAENTTGYLFVERRILRLTMENLGMNNKIEDKSVKQSIKHIINELHFSAIYEVDENNIEFRVKNGAVVKGVLYTKNGDVPGFAKNYIKIKDGWYYYESYRV